MEAIEALKSRCSIRAYKSEQVERALIEQVVDCGRLAASARNVQPWEFVVVTDAEVLKKLSQMCENGRFLSSTPAAIVVLCKETRYYLEDGSAATQNMLVAARALGLGSCWIAGDKKEYAGPVCELVSAPKDCKLISIVALGHPAEKGGKDKRPLKDVLHWGKY